MGKRIQTSAAMAMKPTMIGFLWLCIKIDPLDVTELCHKP